MHDPKYLKIVFKSKHQVETKYINIFDLKNMNYNHKTKHIEILINGSLESGFLKSLNQSSFEIFLTARDGGLYSLDLFELEEEAV